jgi:protein TonB
MQSNLKLVANSTQGTKHTHRNAEHVLARNLVLHPLATITPAANNEHPRTHDRQAKPAYMLLALVAGIHLVGIAWLLSVAGTTAAIAPLKAEINTITVSLLSPPVAKPTIVPPTEPKPVVKLKPAKAEPVKTEPAKTKIVSTKAEASVTPPPADVNAELALVAAPAEPVAAPAAAAAPAEANIEPPRFAAAYLQNPAPEYPQLSRRMGEQGRVLLRVLVSSSGLADRVQIETSSGSNKLDEAALKAVEKWNFVPAKRSNQPVSAYVLVPVKFSLNS